MIQEKHDKPIDIPDAIYVAMPFSLRQPFKKVADVRLSNNFGSILVKFKIYEKMFESLPYFKTTFNKLKSSLGMFGVLYATKMTVCLPFTMPKFLSEDLTRKFTLIYTNVMASK